MLGISPTINDYRGRGVRLTAERLRHILTHLEIPYRPSEGRSDLVASKIKVWLDVGADYLEVQFEDAPGSMRETRHDAVMERIDSEGRVIGFSVLGVSQFSTKNPLALELAEE